MVSFSAPRVASALLVLGLSASAPSTNAGVKGAAASSSSSSSSSTTAPRGVSSSTTTSSTSSSSSSTSSVSSNRATTYYLNTAETLADVDLYSTCSPPTAHGGSGHCGPALCDQAKKWSCKVDGQCSVCTFTSGKTPQGVTYDVSTALDYQAKLSAVAVNPGCVQSSDPRCSAAALAALVKGDGIKAAYCNDRFLVVHTSMSGSYGAWVADVPNPPSGSADATDAFCQTGVASMYEDYGVYKFPLAATPLPTADAATNNVNDAAFPAGTSRTEAGAYVSADGRVYGLPAHGPVGLTIEGQEIFPVYNSDGYLEAERCSIDTCGQQVGAGGGQPHLRGDPFGAWCLYDIDDYSGGYAHPPQIGWILDGYPTHGRHISTYNLGFNVALDACGGHEHDGLGYHYHAQVLEATTDDGRFSAPTFSPNVVASAYGAVPGEGYLFTTPGPYQCLKGDLSAIPNFWSAWRAPDAAPDAATAAAAITAVEAAVDAAVEAAAVETAAVTVDTTFDLCEGSTQYYVAPGYTLPLPAFVVTPSPEPDAVVTTGEEDADVATVEDGLVVASDVPAADSTPTAVTNVIAPVATVVPVTTVPKHLRVKKTVPVAAVTVTASAAGEEVDSGTGQKQLPPSVLKKEEVALAKKALATKDSKKDATDAVVRGSSMSDSTASRGSKDASAASSSSSSSSSSKDSKKSSSVEAVVAEQLLEEKAAKKAAKEKALEEAEAKAKAKAAATAAAAKAAAEQDAAAAKAAKATKKAAKAQEREEQSSSIFSEMNEGHLIGEEAKKDKSDTFIPLYERQYTSMKNRAVVDGGKKSSEDAAVKAEVSAKADAAAEKAAKKAEEKADEKAEAKAAKATKKAAKAQEREEQSSSVFSEMNEGHLIGEEAKKDKSDTFIPLYKRQYTSMKNRAVVDGGKKSSEDAAIKAAEKAEEKAAKKAAKKAEEKAEEKATKKAEEKAAKATKKAAKAQEREEQSSSVFSEMNEGHLIGEEAKKDKSDTFIPLYKRQYTSMKNRAVVDGGKRRE